MIQLTKAGVVITASEKDLERLQAQFAREHYFVRPRMIKPGLLDLIVQRAEAARYPPLSITELL